MNSENNGKLHCGACFSVYENCRQKLRQVEAQDLNLILQQNASFKDIFLLFDLVRGFKTKYSKMGHLKKGRIQKKYQSTRFTFRAFFNLFKGPTSQRALRLPQAELKSFCPVVKGFFTSVIFVNGE